MKKISALVAILFIAGALFALTVNPSLDGRAVVAERGVFPSGNYGKAPGYLPGDTVIVTNHSTGFALEVMILSTSDASEGIAILLSPEAADKLNIVRGKDVYVKIQKKQAIPFEKVLTASDKETGKDIASDPDKNPSKVLEDSPELLQFLKDSKAESEIKKPEVIEIVPEESNEITQETPVEENKAESNTPTETAEPVVAEKAAIADAGIIEEEVTLIPEDIISVSEEEIAIFEEEIPILEETEPLPPEEFASLNEEAAEIISEEVPAITEEIAVIEPEAVEDSKEPLVDEIIPVFEEPVEIAQEEVPAITEEIAGMEPEAVEDYEEPLVDEVIPVFEEPVEIVQEELPVVTEEIAIIELENIADITDETLEIVPEEVAAVDEAILIVEEPSVVYDSSEPRNIFEEIVSGLDEEIPELIPSTGNPPEIVQDDEAIIPVEEVVLVEPVPVESVTSEVEAKGIEKYSSFLKKSDSLEKNKYYIQIATLQEIESIDTVVASYGKKYPLSLIQIDARYQVLVGPFTDDEYAVIYERFRQKEFKDAFIKKIK
jgi:hypothetical protein